MKLQNVEPPMFIVFSTAWKCKFGPSTLYNFKLTNFAPRTLSSGSKKMTNPENLTPFTQMIQVYMFEENSLRLRQQKCVILEFEFSFRNLQRSNTLIDQQQIDSMSRKKPRQTIFSGKTCLSEYVLHHTSRGRTRVPHTP